MRLLFLCFVFLVIPAVSHFLRPNEPTGSSKEQCIQLLSSYRFLNGSHSPEQLYKIHIDFFRCLEISGIEFPKKYLKAKFSLYENLEVLIDCLNEGRYMKSRWACDHTLHFDCKYERFMECMTTQLEITGKCSDMDLHHFVKLEPLFVEYCNQNKFMKAERRQKGRKHY
ncbi:hypothetical protein CAEBREN_05044 [Caenorhabditis brenneri]|uniref:DUF19 domain-containing protein n=1 Tax=Caenorhabditis brenneri TaxID=135651 RepID=G0NNP9_CAEBE|nr:hypothetical protein CAEBREN_05044 [Caenorhabditis brenneri]